nr:hypothetical protein [Anaerolineae bacterium]
MKNSKLLIIGWAFVFIALFSCRPSGPDVLPTVTPTRPAEATPVPTPEAGLPTPPPDDRALRQQLVRATVQVAPLVEENGRRVSYWYGSGSIVSHDGYILTNAHVVIGPDPANLRPVAIGIAITSRSDEPPEPTYLAEPVVVDEQVDLAILRIVSHLDGSPVSQEELNSLSVVEIGDSDLLEVGDRLRLLGYQGIGGESITLTEGAVSGFTRERGIEGRAWIKTDAVSAGGNSGGLASDMGGHIVGVPTQVGYGQAERVADCRYLADTNDDGVINQYDTCIPVGGFINALRPINLAKPLIEAARTGIAPRPTPKPAIPPSGEPRFYNLVFAPDVTDNDQPTQIVTQLPSGATDIYAFWEYEGMADGMTWEARWYYEGQFLDEASWPPDSWKGGEAGSWWISIYNTSGLADGTYRVELYVEGELLAQGSISVGGAVTGPAFTNLIFSDGVTADDRPTNPTYLLPSGITKVYAFFDYTRMRDGMAWNRAWYYEGEQVATGSGTWDMGPSGSAWVALSADEPLDPGTYRLELYVESALVAASNFTVAGTQAQEAIGPIAFAAGVDEQGNPVNPGTTFSTGLLELHFFCTYAGMQNGMNFDEKWLLNGEELVTFNLVWEEGTSGTFHDYIYRTSGEPLPDGQYTLELYVEGQLAQSATAIVGTGAPPPTPTPPAEGLLIQGYIRDADTGQGIPGAAYVVLNPGVTIEGWDGSDEQVYTWAQTDANGYFELPRLLERNQRYSIIVWAEGYVPTSGDNLLVSDEPSPLEVEITLQRQQ